MLAISEKSFRETDDCEALKVPYSPELKEFFTLSRTYQTLNSDSEGKRTFQFHERNVIEEFITCAMYSKKFTEGTIALDEEEKRGIKHFTERMINESRKYNCKVHFSVIWVYNFTYCNEKMESLPVFKIYKEKGGVIFLDAFSKVYQSWDNFIDNVELGESLLCVPRHGEYTYHEGQLSLEYVLSKKIRRAAKAGLCLRFIASFPQVHCSWLGKVESWLEEHPKVRKVMNDILSFLKDNFYIIFSISLAVIDCFFQLGPGELPLSLCKEAIRIALNCVDLTKSWEGFQEFLSESQKALNMYCKARPEVNTLFMLMREERKNWLEILKTLFRLVETSKTVGGLPQIKQNSLSSHVGMYLIQN